jgi:hypothetical protein
MPLGDPTIGDEDIGQSLLTEVPIDVLVPFVPSYPMLQAVFCILSISSNCTHRFLARFMVTSHDNGLTVLGSSCDTMIFVIWHGFMMVGFVMVWM